MEFKSAKFSDLQIRLVSKKRTAKHLEQDSVCDDVKVLAQFPAHRGLLASYSTWFEAKLLWPTATTATTSKRQPPPCSHSHTLVLHHLQSTQRHAVAVDAVPSRQQAVVHLDSVEEMPSAPLLLQAQPSGNVNIQGQLVRPESEQDAAQLTLQPVTDVPPLVSSQLALQHTGSETDRLTANAGSTLEWETQVNCISQQHTVPILNSDAEPVLFPELCGPATLAADSQAHQLTADHQHCGSQVQWDVPMATYSLADTSNDGQGGQSDVLDVVTTEEESFTLQVMMQFMYARHQEGTGAKPRGAAVGVLKGLSQQQLIGLLLVCDFYGVHMCSKEAAGVLKKQKMDVSTVSGLYALPDSLLEQDSIKPVMAAAKARLLQLFGDLEVTMSDNNRRRDFLSLPLAAVADILASPESKAISEDTAAVAACSWVHAQAAQPSEQDVNRLFGLLRLHWLSSAFRSVVLTAPAYQALCDYMQHPDRKAQLDFFYAWRNSQDDNILAEIKDHEEFQELRVQQRPLSWLKLLMLRCVIPQKEVYAAIKAAKTDGAEKSFCTDTQMYAGFLWQGRLIIDGEGCSMYLIFSPHHMKCPNKPRVSSFVVLKWARFYLGTGPLTHDLRDGQLNEIIPFGTPPGIDMEWEDLKESMSDGNLVFTMVVGGPPLL